jgi:hypothetical protein
MYRDRRCRAGEHSDGEEDVMRLHIVERVADFIHEQATKARERLDFDYGQYDEGPGDTEPPVHPVMKAHEFEYGCDDLGQYEGDLDWQVPPAAPRDADYLH